MERETRKKGGEKKKQWYDYFGDLRGKLYFGCNVIRECTARYIYIFLTLAAYRNLIKKDVL